MPSVSRHTSNAQLLQENPHIEIIMCFEAINQDKMYLIYIKVYKWVNSDEPKNSNQLRFRFSLCKLFKYEATSVLKTATDGAWALKHKVF